MYGALYNIHGRFAPAITKIETLMITVCWTEFHIKFMELVLTLAVLRQSRVDVQIRTIP